MDPGMISLIGILVAMVVLIVGSIKGFPIMIIGPVSAIIVFAFSGLPIIENMGGVYSDDFGGFATSNFLLFLPACILGSMLGDCGAAQAIANKIGSIAMSTKGKNQKYWVLMGLSLITALLSFGGVSGFVVIFTIAPICREIFKKMDIPWHFIIAVAVYGGSMWTAILPGSPAIQNLIPIDVLGTTAMSAPILGLIGAAMCIVFGAGYMWFVLKRNEARGEGYLPTGALLEKEVPIADDSAKIEDCSWLDFFRALAPSIVLIVCMNVFNIKPWVSITIGCLLCWVLYINKFEDLGKTLGNGCVSTMKSIMNVSAVVGFGAAVEMAPGFDYVVANLDKIPGPALIQLALATNLVAGITGSASGGEAIALNVFADRFLAMGISPDVLHRLVNISCYGLDSMPYNGSAINRLNYTRLDYKRGYIHEFILGCVFPFFMSLVIAVIASFGIA